MSFHEFPRRDRVQLRFAFGPQIEAAADDGVAMTFYKSWNYTWFDPTPYFSKLTDFTVGVDAQLQNANRRK